MSKNSEECANGRQQDEGNNEPQCILDGSFTLGYPSLSYQGK
jgi:hypothetical protein